MKALTALSLVAVALLASGASQDTEGWSPADMGMIEGKCVSADYMVNELRSQHGIENVNFLPCKNALIAKTESLFVFLREGDKRPTIAFSGKTMQNGFTPSSYQLDGLGWIETEGGQCMMRQSPQSGQLALECWAIEANSGSKTAVAARLVTDNEFPSQ